MAAAGSAADSLLLEVVYVCELSAELDPLVPAKKKQPIPQHFLMFASVASAARFA